MKILVLTNEANGLYLFRKELLLALMGDGHEIYVSFPPDENLDKLRRLSQDGKHPEIIETPFERRGNNPVKDFGLFRTYLRLVKKHNPDAVLTYTIKPNLYGGLACSIKGVSYICNITGLGTAIENAGLLSKILLLFYRISMKKAKRVFFQNGKNLEFMNMYRVAYDHSKLLPGSGVNLTEHPYEAYPSEENGICFLAVIRIMKDKGVEEYLQAARLMKKKNNELKFYLVGEYEEETRGLYEPQINKLHDEKIIKYFGHVDNVEEIMAKSHIIVHPSYHEGLSNVLLEAAACGRPVLASDINGCIETFEEGKSGFSFRVKSVEALVEAMEKILRLSQPEREKMGAAGRVWIEKNFDRNIIIEAYRDELKSIEKDKCT